MRTIMFIFHGNVVVEPYMYKLPVKRFDHVLCYMHSTTLSITALLDSWTDHYIRHSNSLQQLRGSHRLRTVWIQTNA